MLRIESCAKQQVCIDYLSEERASAHIRIEQRSDFSARKSLETTSGVILNQSQSKFTAKRSQMKCDV